MPPQSKPKGSRRSDGASSANTSDPRFASMTTDPRFRLPSARNSRVGVDKRFSRMFKDDDFSKKASVDRYGRKVAKGNSKKELERFYKIDDEKPKPKRADREVVGSDDEADEEGGEEERDEGVEVDEDSDVEGELRRLDPARQGGFSSSEDESSSDAESDDDDEAEAAVVHFPSEQQSDVPMGDVSARLAVVNLDWDNMRASDLMAVATSFAPPGGRISHVVVYPSQFGKERMEKEELEGPPRDIFASAAHDADDDDSDAEEARIKKQLLKEDDGEEFDSARLRSYQLDRLKYYYAVITCDSTATAKALYDAMDGREYLSTANFFDVRFVPDAVAFDDDTPRDDCSRLPPGYRPNDFVTDALTHSKVRLTWDADDTTRKEVQKRAFSRAEIDENDLQAYIGSDSSGGEDEGENGEKLDKADAQRRKMRAALGLSTAAPVKAVKSPADGPVGDMQITFTSGLSSAKSAAGVFENEPATNETTREQYIRKERERKARRKEKMKASREGGADAAPAPAPASKPSPSDTPKHGAEQAAPHTQEDPFNDPFFNDPITAQKAEKEARKAARQQKRADRDAADAATAAKRAELELLMVDDKDDKMRHFDMNAISRAEKAAKKGRKGKKAAKADAGEAAVEGADFVMETQDPRFAKLFDSHEYAIDPTNPRFKATSGMKALLDEGRKKRKGRAEEDDGDDAAGAAPAERKEKKVKVRQPKDADGSSGGGGGEDLQKLLARVKAKTRR